MVLTLVLLGVAAIATLTGFFMRKKMSSLASRVDINLADGDPSQLAANVNADVIVGGIAAGDVVESPWSKRQGLIFEAVRVYEHRNHNGETSTRSNHLGTHMQRFFVISGDRKIGAGVTPASSVSLMHFPKVAIPNNMLGNLLGSTSFGVSLGGVNLGGGRDRVEEAVVSTGDPVWVVGKLNRAADGSFQISGEEVVISAVNGEEMEESYDKKSKIAFLVAGAGVVAAIITLFL